MPSLVPYPLLPIRSVRALLTDLGPLTANTMQPVGGGVTVRSTHVRIAP